MKTSPDQLTEATETQEATKESKNLTWLILVYRVPSEPTRLRGAVWRKLRNLGAVYMQNSAAAIPRTVSTERTMRALRKEIVESMSGKAFLINSSSVASDADLRAMFNEARNDEYEEILDKCKDFHTGIDKEIREEHYTYGELEENEEDLQKLRGWYEKVKTRDVLGAAKAQEVVAALAECAEKLEAFASEVYEADNASL
ncbi:MAG TPA: Chromate resistance protein ChrB [Leifsonia sp.]|jgi:hypothetical protein|nr:Chromate resistance protein ChrB [Leifsonia sp.]